MKTNYVDFETARAASGLRLVTLANVPSPWSEAAKGIFHVEKIPFVATRLAPGDQAMREWTGVKNAPAVMWNDEPARSGWAEILELAERIAPSPSLVPKDIEERVKMLGLAHEMMGEGGILWNARIHAVHLGLTTNGERGFPPPVAAYLGKRYGYAKERASDALAIVNRGFRFFAEALGARAYFIGDRLSALDIYVASGMNLAAMPPEDRCGISPMLRAAFASTAKDYDVPASLVAHRDRMYEKHLELPITI